MADKVENFPDKPITIIVGFPAGGSLDIVAQPLTKAANELNLLPQPIQVIHHPGEAGTLGMARLLDAPADGYTINLGAMGLLTLQPNLRNLQYKTADDYTPIIGLVSNPVSIAIRADAPFQTVKAFIAFAKANPGKIRVGDLGKGSALHMSTEQMKLTADIDLTCVHMTGSPENLQALLDGKVQAVTNHHAVFTEEVNAGNIKVLGVFEPERNALFPESETFLENGYDIIFDSYTCMTGPKDLPNEITMLLHDTFKKAMASPIFIEPMKERGLDLNYQHPSDLKNILNRDYLANQKVIRAIGLSAV